MSSLPGSTGLPGPASSSPRERPYRSHLRPACVSCRRRKSRCKVDSGEATCLMCRVHGTDCQFPVDVADSKKVAGTSTRRSQLRTRGSPPCQPPAVTAGLPNSDLQNPGAATGLERHPRRGETTRLRQVSQSVSRVSAGKRTGMDATETPFPDLIGSSDDDASHVIGPDLSKDTEVLANYLPGKACISRGALAGAPGQHGLRATPAGVLFTTVRRKPIGLTVDQPTTFRKCEIIEKLVEPFATDLVNMYFEKVNQCFPLLDEASFMRQYAHDKGKLSSALLACLYAQCMTFWRHSGVLSQRHRPDPRFVWNQATEAMYSELHVSPGMSTIISLLLNLNGRPLTTMVGNGVQLASAVSIAHSLGLNRNPSDWDIPQGEKSTRIRLWWALFVLDKWSSLAYGTPPHLKRGQHDVVRPTLEAFCGQPASMQSKSASVFRALVSLTEVLDTYLEHAYRLGPHEDRYPATVATEMELQLNQWEDSLEDGLRRVITRGMELVIPGSANLRLAYLYMKLLLTRLQLDLQKQHDVPNNSLLTNRYAQVRRAAEEIVLLIQGLNESHLCDFWLPLSAFTLSSTVTFLLRCALETEHSSLGLAQSMSLKLANDMIIALRGHRQTCEWDIGDICLVQYGKIVEDLSTSCSSNADDSLDIHGLREAMITHVQDIDELFPSLWDMFNGTSESL